MKRIALLLASMVLGLMLTMPATAAKGRFEPLTREGWVKTYYASPIDLGGGVPGSQPNMKESALQKVEVDESH